MELNFNGEKEDSAPTGSNNAKKKKRRINLLQRK